MSNEKYKSLDSAYLMIISIPGAENQPGYI